MLPAAKSLVLVGYRIFLHRLHRYPGPFFSKLTDWYAGAFAIQQRLPQKILQLHQTYGSVIRIGPDRLVFNTITALQGKVSPKVYQVSHVSQSVGQWQQNRYYR